MALRVPRSARIGGLLACAAVVLAVLPGSPSTPAVANTSAYALSTQTYPDGNRVVARWNPCQTAITYRVNPKYAAKKKKARTRAVKDVKRAMAQLGSATGMTFAFKGRTTMIPRNTSQTWATRQKSAEIHVAWVKQSTKKGRTNLLGRSGGGWAAGSGGYGYKFWRVGDEPWSGATGRGFVVLDASQNKKFKPGFGKGTRRGELLLHELGHVVGLDHVSSRSQVMYPTVGTSGSTSYAPGDREGLARLGRSAGCISVPNWVWNDLS
jgi:hypothetical protein